MRPFFKFKMKANQPKVAQLSIYDEIGPWGVSAAGFRAGMDSVKDADTIELEINSYGGDVFAGLSIYNMLMASGKTINVKVMGVAASAASLIMMAGSSRSMPKNTMVMVHNPWGVAIGNSTEMRETADLLDKIGVGLHETYAKVTGLGDDELKAMLGKDTWLSADEALEHGFATEVTDEIEAQASFDINAADIPEAAKAIYAAARKPAPKNEGGDPPPAKTPEQIQQEADEAEAARVEAERAAAQAAIDAGESTVAAAVHQMAVKAGLKDHADYLAVACASTEDGAKRVKEAGEIVAVATFAKRPAAEIASLVRSGKSVAECRTDIMTAMAEEDVHTSTIKPVVPQNSSAKGVKSSDDVFAARAARRQARVAKTR